MSASVSSPHENPTVAGTPQDQLILSRMTKASHILYVEGQNDFNHGQISARRGNSDEFWIRGAAMGFDEVTENSFGLCNMAGEKLSGNVTIPPEWPIHSAVYSRKTTINAIVHTHAPNALIFGAMRRPLVPISHDGCVFYGKLGYFDLTTNTILDLRTANAMVDELGDGKALLLKNHGLVTAGANIKEATILALCLEQACAFQLRAEASGTFSGSDSEDVLAKRDFIFSAVAINTYWSYFERKLSRVLAGQQLPEHRV
ncbi:class II aldolase/adducin family protein [Agrobacterium vitis]|uniref:Class II aldolase/adducin family protein n=1 Tax=Agrobacterium vitis TaxID=373 RepID=A0A6L6VL52_AGRVI|nr:class II aldolase/adducin family protein [Agrobacterium vitis]MUZ75831.1 class II aldolase/adducin family protein [Agrobacterium vitis]MVA22743.1 class II aldolase/adducin family protein [Agrobacterium vitis]